VAYTTGSEVKAQVITALTPGEIDALVIPEAESSIDSYTCCDFNYHPGEVEILDADDDNYVWLNGYPLISVESVKVHGDVIDPTRYIVRYNCVVLKYGSFRRSYMGGWSSTLNSSYYNTDEWGSSGQFGRLGFVRGVGIIEVDYTYGYTAVPPIVSRACRILAINNIIESQRENYEKAVDDQLAEVSYQGYERPVSRLNPALLKDTTGDSAVDAMLEPFRVPILGAI
jgi:hypothetical protein